eukprot:8734355-Pyramimonas_sp.AAC.1
MVPRALGALWGALGAVLGLSWASLASWGPRGGPKSLLERLGEPLAVSWGSLGSPSEASWAHLG